ncbi:potassium voltage-gated channel subfamily H member 3-like protein [Lates japonicus]|uniref:Potassium voltage-gated channel subfamily H member 3-like protein n=1 Tax=Lates japonicus TaxID=270547 RepID=A0AAD3NBA4_LATJO|nr:potassium voltage-gated channel subfamily H member 3-like protein [Lates japonicus]
MTVLQGEFDPLQCSPPRTIASHYPLVPRQTSTTPPVSHRSAPPSLNSSPHEHTVVPHPYSSSSIPSLSSSSHPSSVTPLLVDLSGPGSEPQTHPQSHLQLLSQSESHLQFQPQSQFISQSYPHYLSQPHLQPLLQPSSMASRSREPLLNLQEMDWGEQTTQLSFIDEGQPSA